MLTWMKFPRTMIWAIDLDDGQLIKALGSNLNRVAEEILPLPPYVLPCFGTQFEENEL